MYLLCPPCYFLYSSYISHCPFRIELALPLHLFIWRTSMILCLFTFQPEMIRTEELLVLMLKQAVVTVTSNTINLHA